MYKKTEDIISAIANTPTKVKINHIENYTTSLTAMAQRQHEIIDIINDIPSADVVERKHGEWVPHGSPFSDDGAMNTGRCSVCDFQIAEDNVKLFNFCPNCGADMRNTKQDEYEVAVEQIQHDELYEPTFNSEDGSM